MFIFNTFNQKSSSEPCVPGGDATEARRDEGTEARRDEGTETRGAEVLGNRTRSKNVVS